MKWQYGKMNRKNMKNRSSYTIKEASGRVCWSSPANIALIKYWGKRGVQLPMNPSISFVLSESKVTTSIEYSISKDILPGIDSFTLNGEEKKDFLPRIENYLLGLRQLFPFLEHARMRINSNSSFPHSAGIASSAAAFSALALCICDIWQELKEQKASESEFLRQASLVARLGSGSACRSVYGGLAVWGKTSLVTGSSDDFAVRLKEDLISPGMLELNDSILIVDSSVKKVSSSGGHTLMNDHPYRESRLLQAESNLDTLLRALSDGDMEKFGQVIENEALSLHALMMSSHPGYLLLRPGTLQIIDKVQEFRKESGIQVYFTLDAGPNIHLIYRKSDKQRVKTFIESELLDHCEDRGWSDDGIGRGPEKHNDNKQAGRG